MIITRKCSTILNSPSSRFFSSNVKKYLTELGHNDKIAQGIIDAFSPNIPTVSEIKALGSTGLNTLAESVQREMDKNKSNKTIRVNVRVPHHNTSVSFDAPVGKTFYQLSKQNHDLGEYLECACSGNAACSTCHVIVDEVFYKKLPAAKEDELDMLDLAADLQDTSRLGCQIKFTEELDGLTVSIPKSVNNLF